MSLRPLSSRSQLTWFRFEQNDAASWLLILPTYYASVFHFTFPLYFASAKSSIRDSSTRKTKIAVLSGLSDKHVKGVRAFLDYYARAVCLGTNRHLKAHFTNELDFCLALDFTKPSPQENRTEIGELEYQAKYHHDPTALADLSRRLASAVRRLPLLKFPHP